MRRRSMTNGNGGPQTPAPGLPLNGSGGPPQGGPLAVGFGQSGPGAGSAGDPSQAGAGMSLPVPVTPARRNGVAPAGKATPPVRKGSPLSISNWRVRWRLVAIIAVPTITALILGVIQIVGSVNNYESFKRVQTLANLNALVVTGIGQLADERDATAGYVAARGGATTGRVDERHGDGRPRRRPPRPWAQITSAAQSVVDGSGYRAQTVLDLQNGVLAGISDLPYIRQAATTTKAPAISVVKNYERIIAVVHHVQRRRRGRHRQRHPPVRRHGAQRAAAHGGRRLAAARLPLPGAGDHAADPDSLRADRPEPGGRPAVGGRQPVQRGGLGRRAADAEQHGLR